MFKVGVVVLSMGTIFGLLVLISNRFSLESAITDPRFAKLGLAFIILNESILNWIFGIPGGGNWIRGDLAFSDNMYGSVLLEGGLVFLIFQIAFVKLMLRRIKELKPVVNISDNKYLCAVKYSLIFFMLYGLFSIPTAMGHLYNYLALLLGGMTRMYFDNKTLIGYNIPPDSQLSLDQIDICKPASLSVIV
jgi:hypothetical protein